MPTSYTTYMDITLNAFLQTARPQEIIGKKNEILSGISSHYDSMPESILFVGFNSWLLGSACTNISVTEVSESTKKLLDTAGVKYTYINEKDLPSYHNKFQWVIAGEEYFTFADSESDQRNKVELLTHVATELIVTTLRDYKNQDFKDREFGQPVSIRNNENTLIFLEHNNYNFNERNVWKSKVYQIQDNVCLTHGPFNRCSMYFKQLAKFSLDAGALNFLVHKNLMYKSLIKRNYEHVISIKIK